MLEIGVLGPVQLTLESRQPQLSSAVQRALIAALALAEGRVLSYERLVYAVWQEEPSTRRAHNLHFHISKLRGQLRDIEPGRPGIQDHHAAVRLPLRPGRGPGGLERVRDSGVRSACARTRRR